MISELQCPRFCLKAEIVCHAVCRSHGGRRSASFVYSCARLGFGDGPLVLLCFCGWKYSVIDRFLSFMRSLARCRPWLRNGCARFIHFFFRFYEFFLHCVLNRFDFCCCLLFVVCLFFRILYLTFTLYIYFNVCCCCCLYTQLNDPAI